YIDFVSNSAIGNFGSESVFQVKNNINIALFVSYISLKFNAAIGR
ncbi:MAG: hypothetical protein ACI8VI_001390, partial [Granulosicoccus sp.]